MSNNPVILCIGSVLWDVIGRTPRRMALGHDVPGTITRIPGGVALNIAMACLREGMRPALLSVLGKDAEGRSLAEACEAMGLVTSHLTWSDSLSTDVYMAIEAENGLVAAVADAHSLERAGEAILTPLTDGTLAHGDAPWTGMIALDGNLTEALLSTIAASPTFAAADLRVAPASPGKAQRLLPLVSHPRATLYMNRIEAGILCDTKFDDAEAAARAVRDLGARRVIVTDGGATVCEATRDRVILANPPAVRVVRITGAGDTFMAAHIAAEARGQTGESALDQALSVTAAYISQGST